MTAAFPYQNDCYTWPKVAVFTNEGAAELHVHCLWHVGQRRYYCVGFIGVDRQEQIGQVANLAETVGAEVKVIQGLGFTDEIIGRLMAAMETTADDPGGSFCCVPVDWPDKAQRRVLRKAMDMTTRGVEFHEEKLAKRLHMPVEEVRRHLEVLADIGLMEKVR
jgi:hypothetical protein